MSQKTELRCRRPGRRSPLRVRIGSDCLSSAIPHASLAKGPALACRGDEADVAFPIRPGSLPWQNRVFLGVRSWVKAPRTARDSRGARRGSRPSKHRPTWASA